MNFDLIPVRYFSLPSQRLVGIVNLTLKRRWTEEIAEEAENAAKQQHMKTLYTLTKILSNERPRQSAKVMDRNGKILNDKESKTNTMAGALL